MGSTVKQLNVFYMEDNVTQEVTHISSRSSLILLALRLSFNLYAYLCVALRMYNGDIGGCLGYSK